MRREDEGPGGQYGHGWLAAVVPADARRFRVADEELAAGLAEAGAELVTESPDVEVAPVEQLRGAGQVAVVSLGGTQPAGSLPVRAVTRLAASARVRVEAARARRTLRRRGYPVVEVIPWDVRHTFRPGSAADGGAATSLVELMPRRALVVARRGRKATLLDAAIAEAGAATGRRLEAAWSSIRAGILVVGVDGAFLRVAVGPAARQIGAQRAALDALRALDVPDVLEGRVPWPLAHGRHGLADWSLETRLTGLPLDDELPAQVRAECVDFLVGLLACRGGETAPSLAERADVVAEVCDEARASAVRAVARRLDDALRGLPRGFGHGDFFAGNLLAEGGRLTGVVDWDAAGPGRLPILDLLHLRYTAEHRPFDDDWGPGILRHLVPWARAGGDEVARGYCGRVGIPADADLLQAAVFAYWLERVAYQLTTHLHRRRQARWLERNVSGIVDEAAFIF